MTVFTRPVRLLKFIILGDFNTDFFSNPSQNLMDILNLQNFYQLTFSPTRITETTNSCSDLIITQIPQLVTYTEVLPAICNDHSVPFLYIRNAKTKKKPFTRIIYNYNKLNTDKCCNLLAQVSWTNIIESNTIDVSTTDFTDIFFFLSLDIAKRCMPNETVIVRQNGAPWLSDEIRLFIR